MIEETRQPIIIGSKIGCGGGAKEANDTLFARHQAAVLDVISEGEIVGLVDGASSIFFNLSWILEFISLEATALNSLGNKFKLCFLKASLACCSSLAFKFPLDLYFLPVIKLFNPTLKLETWLAK